MDKYTKKGKIYKVLILISLFIAIVLAIYLPLRLTGALDKISTAEDLKNVILSFKGYSYLVFILLQILQTTILPIPAVVTTVAGVLVFGAVKTFFLSLFAVLIGSIISFALGRKVGKKLLVWVTGEADAEKWTNMLSKGKFTFFLMMLFPFFPDDILCIVAGMTDMTYRYFILTNLITRPIIFASICFLGSGKLIPFTGWGIPVWIALGILMIALIVLSVVYKQKIENFIIKLAKKSNENASNEK